MAVRPREKGKVRKDKRNTNNSYSKMSHKADEEKKQKQGEKEQTNNIKKDYKI